VREQTAPWQDNLEQVFQDIRVLTEHQLQIDELNTSRINKYALAALGVLVAGLLLLSGGWIAASVLITAGQVTLLASAIFAAATYLVHWNDDSEIRGHYEAILGSQQNMGLADKILIGLRTKDANMQSDYAPPPGPVPDYQPLYPDQFPPLADAPADEAIPNEPPPAYVEPAV
jgi:hypothetical protein